MHYLYRVALASPGERSRSGSLTKASAAAPSRANEKLRLEVVVQSKEAGQDAQTITPLDLDHEPLPLPVIWDAQIWQCG